MATSHRSRRFLALLLSLMLVAIVAAPASAAKTPKTSVCHYDQVLGTYSLNAISASSLAKHLAHGDGIPGEGDFDANCQPVPRVLARAWGDANGDGTYDPLVDLLFSELVDANGSSVPDAGDEIRVSLYPVDFFGAAFFVRPSVQVVTSVPEDEPSVVRVVTSAGEFAWVASTDTEYYGERGNEVDDVTLIDNISGGAVSTLSDHIQMNIPGQFVETSKNRDGDDAWLEVAIYAY